MLDHLIKGGTVVDGTGGEPYVADVGIRDGRIVEVGDVTDDARTVLDASGLLVTPGFIDPHTHYDAQLHWDGWATPSSLHGVTTVIAGNCGFTLAPLKDEDALYTQRMMARVEGMPIDALQEGPSWQWHSFGEFLDRLDGQVAVNAGFLVGHCALRRYVLGEEAVERASTDDEVDAIVALLQESLAAGGLGLSLSRSYTHTDGDGRPVPSRLASEDEVLTLCDVVGRYDGTSLEAITDGCIRGFDDDSAELIAQMSARAAPPAQLEPAPDRVGDGALRREPAAPRRPGAGARRARRRPLDAGGERQLRDPRLVLHLVDGAGLGRSARPARWPRRRRSSPTPRCGRRLLEAAQRPEAGVGGSAARMGTYRFGATNAPENEGLEGRLVAEVAAERGLDDFACVAEASAAEDFDLDFWPVRPVDPNDDPSYRVRLWESPDVLIGGSDAGAHLDHLLGSAYPTRFLAEVLRGSRVLPLERAVRLDDRRAGAPLRPARPRPGRAGVAGGRRRARSRDGRCRPGPADLRPSRRRLPPHGRARGRRAGPRQRRRDDQRRRAHRRAGWHDPALRARHHRHGHQLSGYRRVCGRRDRECLPVDGHDVHAVGREHEVVEAVVAVDRGQVLHGSS